jgi:hypothetical protein
MPLSDPRKLRHMGLVSVVAASNGTVGGMPVGSGGDGHRMLVRRGVRGCCDHGRLRPDTTSAILLDSG